MSVALANMFRTGIFATMNEKKGNNFARADHSARKAAADCQCVSLANSGLQVARETNIGERYTNVLYNALNKSQTGSKLFNYTCKAVEWAGKLVNPLLVLASGFRVAKSDDKKSTAIEEAGAMTGMFAVEGQIKKYLGLTGKAPAYKNNKFLTRMAQKGKNFIATNKWLSKLPQNRVTNIIKGGIFVIGSILSFDIGGRLGKLVAKHTTAKTYAAKHPEKKDLNVVA